MKVPYSWLQDFVPKLPPPEKLAQLLTEHGLEVTYIAATGEKISDDVVFEIDVLPNRSDCLSIAGIAREIAAITGKPLRRSSSPLKERGSKVSKVSKVRVMIPDLCPRYMARVIEGVTIEPSPPNIQRRLHAAGVRPINNVVDVTNYVMLERGQPLHAFDLDKLSGRQIMVRKPNPGEKIITLDGETHELPKDAITICDASHPVAVGGVMGGLESEISDGTQTVLLESAFFDPKSVHHTALLLKTKTESSARFSGGVSWEGVEEALDRAAALISEVSDGKVAEGKIDVAKRQKPAKPILLRNDYLTRLSGISISSAEASRILKSLGFRVQSRGRNLSVVVPSHRLWDVTREEDLIEEIVRLHGYEKIPTTPRPFAHSPAVPSPVFRIRETLREICTAAGFCEAITFGMAGPLGVNDRNAIRLTNPIREDMSVMRTRLLPGLLSAARHNVFHKVAPIALFELGRTYRGDAAQYHESDGAAGVMVGKNGFYIIKGMWEKFFQRIVGFEGNISPLNGQAEDYPHLHPGQSATLTVDQNGQKCTVAFGVLHPRVARQYELPDPVYVFEADLAALADLPERHPKYVRLPQFPAAYRDVSFILSKDIPYGNIYKVMVRAGKPWMEEVSLFDRYDGKNIPEGQISLAFRLTYRKSDGTLRDDEVHAAHQKICSALKSELKANVREG